MKTKDLLSQLAQLESSLNDFSFEELTTEEAALLKTSFNTFRNRLEKRILNPNEVVTSEKTKKNSEDVIKKDANDSKLIAHISHEIRTPLNGIIGFANLLRDEKLNPSQLKKVDAIQNASYNLRDIINEVLEYSKITSGVDGLDIIDFNFRGLVNDVIFLCQTLILDKRVDLRVSIDSKIPKTIIGDPSKLSQVLLNLLGNAIKFVDKGHIELAVGIQRKAQDDYVLEFKVTDTGIGIPQEKLKTIFESFKQAQKDTFNTYGGTGLGLSIVKELIEKQNGEISVVSVEGEGTTFTFTIPYKKGKAINIPAKKVNTINIEKGRALLRGAKILVFEDNLMNQHLITEQLHKWGCKVYITADAEKGLTILETDAIDLILMDLKMPNRDGFEISEEIRSKTHLEHVPIIALSADFTVHDQERCVSAGINDFLLKPYTLDELLIKVLKNRKEKSFTPESKDLLKKETISKDTANSFDLQHILGECFGEIDMLRELVRLFKQNVYEFIGATKIGLGTSDFKEISLCAHKLKASLSMFKALQLRDIIVAMEKSSMAKNGEETSRLFLDFLNSYPSFENQIDTALNKLK
ncbi:ATP-binding protein [Maribacter sp. MJ134]|uniref:ATP-binding protein n=1 Tax=Maribacter sp. MJ134 TaxID=2496865 RepID=UPI0013DF52BA|nr:ATP-binding protein [Maribacter sp. MJ134]